MTPSSAARRRAGAGPRPGSRATARASARRRRAAPRPRSRPPSRRPGRPPRRRPRTRRPAPPCTARLSWPDSAGATPATAQQRSGAASAASNATLPPNERPTSAARVTASSSSRPTTSSTKENGAAGPVDRPKKRWSNRIVRKRSASGRELRLPQARVAEPAVHEHDCGPLAGLLVPEPGAVHLRRGHAPTIASRAWTSSTFSSSAPARWAVGSHRSSRRPAAGSRFTTRRPGRSSAASRRCARA